MSSTDEYELLFQNITKLRCIETSISNLFYRSTSLKYSTEADLLSGEGAKRNGGRWNPVGIAMIYASDTPETAMAETLAHYRYYGLEIHVSMPRLFVAMNVQLTSVLDLTSPKILKRIGMTMSRMTNVDWRKEMNAHRKPISQTIGHAVSSAGFEGFIVKSHANQSGKNIVIIPDNLGLDASLKVLA